MRWWCVCLGLLLPTLAAAEETDRHRFAVSLHGGAGWVDMGQLDSAVREHLTALETADPMFSATAGTSRRLIAVGLRAQWRGPRFVAAELGVDLYHHRAASRTAIGEETGELSQRNRALAVPALLGAHLPLGDRLAATLMIGPLLLIDNRSRWDHSLGEVSSFAATLGAGLEVDAGVEAALFWRLRAAATVRYRFARSAALEVDGIEHPPLPPLGELAWTGISADLGLRIVVD